MNLSPLHTQSGTMQWFQFCRYVSVILISIILAACLDLNDIGRVEYIFFLANMASFFWLSGIKNQMLAYLGKHTSSNREAWYFQYYKTTQLLSCSFVVVLLLVQLVLGLLAWGNTFYILLAVLLLNPVGNLADALLILSNRLKLLRWYASVIHLLRILIIGIVAYVYQDWQMIIFAYLIWVMIKWIFVTIVISINQQRRVDSDTVIADPHIKSAMYKSIVSLSLFALLGGCMDYVDGIMVKYFFGDAEFAIFKYGAREFPLSLLWASAVTTALLPSFSQDEKEASFKLKNQLGKWIPYLFGSAGVLIILSPWLYEWVYASEFRFSALIFNVYLLIIITRVLLPQLLFYAKGWNKELVFFGLIELLFNVALSLILLKFYGLMGIVIATCIAFLIEKIMYISYLKYRSAYSFWDTVPVRSYLCWSLFLVICFAGSTYFHFL